MQKRSSIRAALDKIPQRCLYWTIIGVSFILSLAGILYGAYIGKFGDGGRGGALAVMVSFIILFARKNYGKRVYEALANEIPTIESEIRSLRKGEPIALPTDNDIPSLNRRVVAIVSQMETEAGGQTTQNWALTWASCIATLAWGFGDLAAEGLKCIYPHPFHGNLEFPCHHASPELPKEGAFVAPENEPLKNCSFETVCQ